MAKVKNQIQCVMFYKDIEESIGKYNGTEDVHQWLVKFEQNAELYGWTEFQKIIVAKKSLTGLAALHVKCEAGLNAKLNSWDDLKQCLVKEFSAESHKLLCTRLQLENEEEEKIRRREQEEWYEEQAEADLEKKILREILRKEAEKKELVKKELVEVMQLFREQEDEEEEELDIDEEGDLDEEEEDIDIEENGELPKREAEIIEIINLSEEEDTDDDENIEDERLSVLTTELEEDEEEEELDDIINISLLPTFGHSGDITIGEDETAIHNTMLRNNDNDKSDNIVEEFGESLPSYIMLNKEVEDEDEKVKNLEEQLRIALQEKGVIDEEIESVDDESSVETKGDVKDYIFVHKMKSNSDWYRSKRDHYRDLNDERRMGRSRNDRRRDDERRYGRRGSSGDPSDFRDDRLKENKTVYSACESGDDVHKKYYKGTNRDSGTSVRRTEHGVNGCNTDVEVKEDLKDACNVVKNVNTSQETEHTETLDNSSHDNYKLSKEENVKLQSDMPRKKKKRRRMSTSSNSSSSDASGNASGSSSLGVGVNWRRWEVANPRSRNHWEM